MKSETVTVTTDASGDGSARSSTVFGKLYAVQYRPGTLDTGATITLTCEDGTSKALLTKSSAGTSNVFFYPRDLVNAVADGAALTGTSGGDRACPVVHGQFKFLVASGGNVGTGSVIFYYE